MLVINVKFQLVITRDVLIAYYYRQVEDKIVIINPINRLA